MPRSKENPNEFVAGMLPTISIADKTYYVDGRLQQLRNVNDFMDSIDCVDDDMWNMFSDSDKSVFIYEFMGDDYATQI
jgi:hypothetical protein